MLDCDDCQLILEKEHAGAAEPREAEDARRHVDQCPACREYADFLRRSTPDVDVEFDPDDPRWSPARLRRRVRLAIVGPCLWLAIALAGTGLCVAVGLQTGSVWPWLIALVGALKTVDFAGDLRSRRKAMDQFLASGDFVKRCVDEMNVNRGLNAVMAVVNLALACLWTPFVLFIWRPDHALAIASIFWLLLLYNLFRALVLPKPWNGGAPR